ncbi:Uu.00g007600.m01.CDS01 [Anthostomella pinea]|uniref:Uu.00g007600.m01.CDS01 n=1 Tax=Anthostomella pinea TaxID=933095 RepID=A0AAI8VRA7_9PEZI|nr:Uu.00g007600.m01.CDS01 [Anthostomella pinea]
MRLLSTILSLALATDVAVASTWFSKAAYNKWHETELERWLSDHDVPYPSPADRKDLENLIEKNWENNAVAPYKNWDTEKLTSYLKQKGVDTKDAAGSSKDSLISQVAGSWYETEDKAQSSWTSAKDWILDTWTDSALKSFADKHGIPVPQPRKRDTLLQTVRNNYETVAQKVGETASYPGNWLYESWTESDLKEWLDTHGIPAPQPTNRDKLIAAVRRNSRTAYLKAQDQAASASASANAAYATVTDKLIDAWGESQLKEFCDKNGINVPQGTKTNELRALVRKHRSEILGDSVSASAASAFGAATSNVGNSYTKATDTVSLAAQEAFDATVGTWSDSRLKAYLDARGVPVPQGTKTDELRALVRRNSHKAAHPNAAWSWGDLSLENLRKYLASSGDSAAKKVGESSTATRDELVDAAQSAYASASSAGGGSYASATSFLAQATGSAKQSTFDTWSESDLKSYLDSYGVPVPQGSTLNQLKAEVRKQSTYFKYGTTSPTGTAFAKIGESVKGAYNWVAGQLGAGSEAAKSKAKNVKEEL